MKDSAACRQHHRPVAGNDRLEGWAVAQVRKSGHELAITETDQGPTVQEAAELFESHTDHFRFSLQDPCRRNRLRIRDRTRPLHLDFVSENLDRLGPGAETAASQAARDGDLGSFLGILNLLSSQARLDEDSDHRSMTPGSLPRFRRSILAQAYTPPAAERETRVLLQEMSWPAVKAAAASDLPVVLPIAAVEQHGHHMPVHTDSMLLGEVVRRASSVLHDRVVWAPLLWLGNSHHHIDFAGTLSAAPRTYLDVLGDLIDNVVTHGFKRILLLNGHGGNIVPAQQAVFEARQRNRHRDDLLLLTATYWTLGSKPNEAIPGLVQDRMGHACEWETSMMLALAPNLVGHLPTIEPIPLDAAFEPAMRGWITRERTAAGHIGDPASATLEKGEALYSNFASGVVTFLERVIAWDGRSWDG
jgi:creatinine amidohydrolase